jgi:Ni/Fe-hydrogenase subunit HybB-like protein
VSNSTPLPRRLVTPLTLVLAALTLIGFYFIALRMIYGLGGVTNLNPGYPWGIWVVGDIMVGTAIGCGGISMAIVIYFFNGAAYHPLMRPALLGSVLGYTLGAFGAFIDLGRYWQAYNILLPWYWQPNSVMFELVLCMTAYTAVAWIEFAPVILERFKWVGLKRLLDRWMYVVVALGLLLPLMHQSSFGSLILAAGPKLSPLWGTVWLPLLFVANAIMTGYSTVMLEGTVVTESFKLPSEHKLLFRLSRFVGWLIVAWLALRWADLLGRGAAGLAFAGDLKATMFWIENLLYAGVAAVFLTRAGRASRRAWFVAAGALLVAGALYRFDAVLVSTMPVGNWSYFPSVAEIMVTVGIVALEILIYLVVIKTFPVLEGASRSGSAHA